MCSQVLCCRKDGESLATRVRYPSLLWLPFRSKPFHLFVVSCHQGQLTWSPGKKVTERPRVTIGQTWKGRLERAPRAHVQQRWHHLFSERFIARSRSKGTSVIVWENPILRVLFFEVLPFLKQKTYCPIAASGTGPEAQQALSKHLLDKWERWTNGHVNCLSMFLLKSPPAAQKICSSRRVKWQPALGAACPQQHPPFPFITPCKLCF